MNYKMVHTCIRVKNLDDSLKFYKEAFGFVEKRRKDHTDDGFILVFIGNDESPHQIELTYNIGQGGYNLGDGFSHIGVVVENLEESHQKHIDGGFETTDMYGLPGEAPRFYFVTDPDGYDIEVIRA